MIRTVPSIRSAMCLILSRITRILVVWSCPLGILPKWRIWRCRHGHALFQFYVADGKLSCQLYQRSCDMFLGVPFNIASYSLLTLMIAQQAGLQPGEFVWTGGDCHVYDNHIDQVLEQLSRDPYPYPQIRINKADSLFDYDYSDFEIVGYQHHPTIKAPVAV